MAEVTLLQEELGLRLLELLQEEENLRKLHDTVEDFVELDYISSTAKTQGRKFMSVLSEEQDLVLTEIGSLYVKLKEAGEWV